VPQPHADEGAVDGRERGDLDAAQAQLGLCLAQRDAGPGREQGPQEGLVRPEHRGAVAADLARFRAAGLPHAAHRLHRR
jgi:hypothetical protein